MILENMFRYYSVAILGGFNGSTFTSQIPFTFTKAGGSSSITYTNTQYNPNYVKSSGIYSGRDVTTTTNLQIRQPC